MNLEDFNIKPFTCFRKDWGLITAGDKDEFNSMTIGWGGFGTMWSVPVVFLFVKPSRYTSEIIKRHDEITVSFYPEECRKALSVMGTISGRDHDKVKESGLTPVFLENGVTYKEATETVVARKIYMDQMDKSIFPEFALAKYVGENETEAHYFIIAQVSEVLTGESIK